MAEQLNIVVDRLSPVPLYFQVASSIEQSIDSGELEPGAFLENENMLAARLQISRPTARQALQLLVDKGRLIRKRGVGTRVAPRQIQRSVELTSLQADLERAGRNPSTRVLAHEHLAADAEVAALLGLEIGAPVVRIRRLRLADGEPLAVLSNLLPAEGVPDVQELTTAGLYDCLRARGIVPRAARQRISARIATLEEAELLGEKAGAALITMERTAYDDTGRVLEQGEHVYRPSLYIFDTTVSVE